MSERRAEDGWIEWAGGKCPVDPRAFVVVRMRDGWEHEPTTAGFWAGDGSASQSNWLHSGEAHNIVAYREVSA